MPAPAAARAGARRRTFFALAAGWATMALEPLPASRDDEPASGAQAAPVAETAHAAAGDVREAGDTTP